MQPIEGILPLLRGLKATGTDRWTACCPSHEDKTPSMTLRALPDGRVLLHCFAGCEVQYILGSLGLTFRDLFPKPLTRDYLPRIHAPFSALEALQCLAAESAVLAVVAADISEGKPIAIIDAKRVCLASGRITAALEGVHGV